MAILVQSNKKPSVSFPEQTGSIVTFNSQYAGLPLKSHKIALTATQSGSGTPSPDNVRPISGHDSIIISHSGADVSTPTVYIINLGGTYYGGEYDARTGILTVTHYYFKGGFTYYNASNGYKAYRRTNLPFTVLRDEAIKQIICNMVGVFGSFNSSNMTRNIISPVDSSHNLYMALDENYSADDVEVCYKLATPTTIQLQPCPIDTLEGVNNIWADTGETTVQYIKIGG